MEEKKVSWLELFFDLVFVTAVSYTTSLFVSIEHHPGHMGKYLGEYLLMVFPMFWLWSGQTMFMNRYGQHLRRPEVFMLPQMFCFILMTASFDFAFAHTYHSYLASYLGLRLLTVLEYALTAKKLEGPQKEVATLLGRLFVPGLLIPFSSLFFPEQWRYTVMYGGIISDMLLPLLFRRRLLKAPVHMGHLAERFGLFVLITFGESLVSVAAVLSGHTREAAMLLFSILCFINVCLMWLLYFHAYENLVDRGTRTNGQVLLYGHFFILIAIMLLAGNIELMAAAKLPVVVLTTLLFGPMLVFFLAANLVFFRHRKRDKPYFIKEACMVCTALALLWLFSAINGLAPMVSLALAAVLLAIANVLQRGLHFCRGNMPPGTLPLQKTKSAK